MKTDIIKLMRTNPGYFLPKNRISKTNRYSAEDMMRFAEYCSHQFNVCDSFGNWYHEWGEKEDTKTTQQLLKEYEE